MEELKMTTAKLNDLKLDVQDPLLEVNLGSEGKYKPIYVSQLLDSEFQAELIIILQNYKDCFAWEYDEMPGLARELVEHRLLVREGYMPFK